MSDVIFQALCATLDHFDAGFVAVFPDGKILHANRMAREMMSGGWPIQASNGYLQASSRKPTTLLLNCLQQVAEAAASSPSEDICLDICLADAASPHGVAIASMKPLLILLSLTAMAFGLASSAFGRRGDGNFPGRAPTSPWSGATWPATGPCRPGSARRFP